VYKLKLQEKLKLFYFILISTTVVIERCIVIVTYIKEVNLMMRNLVRNNDHHSKVVCLVKKEKGNWKC